MSCVLGYTALANYIIVICDFWGMFVRVYPWIIQGLTSLSAWKTQMYINNYNTCSFVVQVDAFFYLLSISELVTSVASYWFLLV